MQCHVSYCVVPRGFFFVRKSNGNVSMKFILNSCVLRLTPLLRGGELSNEKSKDLRKTYVGTSDRQFAEVGRQDDIDERQNRARFAPRSNSRRFPKLRLAHPRIGRVCIPASMEIFQSSANFRSVAGGYDATSRPSGATSRHIETKKAIPDKIHEKILR